jgi:putative NADH-flavin reductase
MKVLVTGANGLLGVNLIRELVQSGVKAKAFVRPGVNLKVLEDVECEVHRGNSLSFDDINDALRDCDAVIHAASTQLEHKPTRGTNSRIKHSLLIRRMLTFLHLIITITVKRPGLSSLLKSLRYGCYRTCIRVV